MYNKYYTKDDDNKEKSQDYQELHKKFDSMKENDNFIESKGGTMEEGFLNLETNQNVLTNTQLNNEEVVEDYSCPQYAGYVGVAAIAVCLIAQALNYMSDHHDYHGFGPSGF
jgi:hypothetical protein